MAKRKAAGARRGRSARPAGGARKPTRRAPAGKRAGAKSGARKTATRKAGGKKAARKTAARAASAGRASQSRKGAKAVARPSKTATRPAPRTTARKTTTPASRASRASRAARPAASPPSAPTRALRRTSPVARKVPAISRVRRTIADEDIVPSPPSSLDLDRSASSARTGRRELLEKYEEHTETSPAITGGDVDADWESAYSVGDEAPGGDNPTPDQDIVEEIGRAVGIEYQDNEELKGEDKIAQRDRHRWELDPASSEDYEDR